MPESDCDCLALPRRRRPAFPEPHDVVSRRRYAAELAQTGGVLSAMVLAVHHALRQCLPDRYRQRRILEPLNSNQGRDALIRQRFEIWLHPNVKRASVVAQRLK